MAPARAAAERLPGVVDVVVIGAGVGGLAAAGHLAMAGRRVLVLEQDHHVGGTAHVFSRRGFRFPAGPLSFTAPGHLVGMLRDLGVTAPLSFERDVFQVVRGDLDVLISVPLERVAEQLARAFPAEREGIRAVIGVLLEVIGALRGLRPEDLIEGSVAWAGPEAGRPESVAGPPSGVAVRPGVGGVHPWPAVAPDLVTGAAARRRAITILRRWEAVPARELIDRHLRDRRLRDLLGSQGATETVMPVVLLAQMWDFMAERGIWYPAAGIDTLGDLLAERVVELGGIVALGRRVTRIVVEKERVAGVVLEDGGVVRAAAVVSGADYRHTMNDLLPWDAAVDADVGAARLPLTPSSFTVFLGVRRESVDLGAFRGHQLLVKLEEGDPIPWAEKRPRAEDFRRDEIWLCWWSRHEDSVHQGAPHHGPVPLAPAGHEAMVVKLMAPFAPFTPLDGGGRGRHEKEYYTRKERLADALVAAAAEIVPGLSEATMVREVATPLTYRDWGHRSAGSVAGWSWRAEDAPGARSRSLVRTSVPGLYVAGLQAFTKLFLGGLGTALYGGRCAAEAVLADGGLGGC